MFGKVCIIGISDSHLNRIGSFLKKSEKIDELVKSDTQHSLKPDTFRIFNALYGDRFIHSYNTEESETFITLHEQQWIRSNCIYTYNINVLLHYLIIKWPSKNVYTKTFVDFLPCYNCTFHTYDNDVYYNKHVKPHRIHRKSAQSTN